MAIEWSEHGKWLRRSVVRTLERRGAALWRRGAWRDDIFALTARVARQVRIAAKEGHCRKPEAYAARLFENGGAKLNCDWERTWELHKADWSPGGKSRELIEASAKSFGCEPHIPEGVLAKLND